MTEDCQYRQGFKVKAEPDIQAALQKAKRFILECQQDSGAILWFADAKLDPWDHVESAMALNILGERDAAERAYAWMHTIQNDDGSWFTQYFGENSHTEHPESELDRAKVETHFVAYIATGAWSHYLIHQDLPFLHQVWPMVEKAVDFVVNQQQLEGDIQWALSVAEDLPQDALITGCSSILRSLEAAQKIAQTVEQEKPQWLIAYRALKTCLRSKPWRFDRTWEPKSRFSMDWFYPILGGVFSQHEIPDRLDAQWDKFFVDDMGCRCVSDQPWMTVAETCELTLALVASNRMDLAKYVHQKLLRWQDDDGGFWTGYNFVNHEIWPREKTSWTAAAFVLAADGIYQLSAASDVFTRAAYEDIHSIEKAFNPYDGARLFPES